MRNPIKWFLGVEPGGNRYDWVAFGWFVAGILFSLALGWIAYCLDKGYLRFL